jgi:hypothetical protein
MVGPQSAATGMARLNSANVVTADAVSWLPPDRRYSSLNLRVSKIVNGTWSLRMWNHLGVPCELLRLLAKSPRLSGVGCAWEFRPRRVRWPALSPRHASWLAHTLGVASAACAWWVDVRPVVKSH